MAPEESDDQQKLREEVYEIRQQQETTNERLMKVEERLPKVEEAVAKIPHLETRMSRVDALLLSLQGDMKKLVKAHGEHSQTIENKLDDHSRMFDELKQLIIASAAD